MKFKDKIEQLKKTERGKSLIKFGWDMLFILFVFILILSSGTLNSKKETSKGEESTIESKTEVSYIDMQKELINGKYEFEYIITGTVNVNYTGSYSNREVTGFRESDDSLIKYHIWQKI